jgi:precorrin-6B methylase 2
MDITAPKDAGKYTKDEIIGVIFSKLHPQHHQVFADIGCGSGKVAEFFAPYVEKVYAIDVDKAAIQEAIKRLEVFGNVEVKIMEGMEFLKEYDYDIVFFGGTVGIEEMLEIAAKKAEKVVVNAARMEVAARVINKMKKLGIFKEALIVNISKSYELSGGTAFRSLNPVFVVVGCL